MGTSASEVDLLAMRPRGKTLALKSLAFSLQSDLEAGTFHIAHALSRILNYKLVPENERPVRGRR